MSKKYKVNYVFFSQAMQHSLARFTTVILLVIATTVLLASSQKLAQRCRCSRQFKAVCDTKRALTFHNACIAKCFGATKLKRGKCEPANQIVKRNICPAYKIVRTPFQQTVLDTLKSLVGRLEHNQKKISNMDERLSNVEIRSKKFVQPVISAMREHSAKRKALLQRLSGYQITGPSTCPNQFKLLYYHFDNTKKIAYRRCIPVRKQQVELVGPSKCPDFNELHVERVGLTITRTCVPLVVTGPATCTTGMLYAYRVGTILRRECVKKCPSGFRIKIRQLASGNIVRQCVFGTLACAKKMKKVYQTFKKDPRVLKSVCERK